VCVERRRLHHEIGIRTLDVLDPDGQWLGPVEFPVEFGRIAAIGPEYLLAFWTDELEVPYLRMYRIDHGTSPRG
jgi:hypothetical protein